MLVCVDNTLIISSIADVYLSRQPNKKKKKERGNPYSAFFDAFVLTFINA
jgi:hypothetical protein